MGVKPVPSSATPPAPRPFSDFPEEARACEPHLRLLVTVGPVLAAGFYSLSRALAEVRKRLGDEAPSYNTLRLLPQKVEHLLILSFGRKAEFYRTVRLGRRVVGLGVDGAEILRLTQDYLATSSRLHS